MCFREVLSPSAQGGKDNKLLKSVYPHCLRNHHKGRHPCQLDLEDVLVRFVTLMAIAMMFGPPMPMLAPLLSICFLSEVGDQESGPPSHSPLHHCLPSLLNHQ